MVDLHIMFMSNNIAHSNIKTSGRYISLHDCNIYRQAPQNTIFHTRYKFNRITRIVTFKNHSLDFTENAS